MTYDDICSTYILLAETGAANACPEEKYKVKQHTHRHTRFSCCDSFFNSRRFYHTSAGSLTGLTNGKASRNPAKLS